MYNFKIRNSYSFQIYPSSIIPDDFTNVLVMGEIDWESANMETDIYAQHAQCYPYLPAGTPNNPEHYNYLKLKTTTGAVRIIGIPFIKEETITEIGGKTILVEIPNRSSEDVAAVTAALVSNGFQVGKISLV